ncbi:MAG: synaptic vesicle VAT-1 family membrane protein [bacterium]
MRQIWITKAGAPEVLEVRESADPQPGQDEVVIAVKAAGINFADIMARKGIYPDAPKLPAVVGYEVAGIVAAVGKSMASLKSGDPVVALTRFGGYSEMVKAPAEQVFAKPKNLSFEAAAAIPVNYLTAYQLLVVMGALRAGETVLIQNAGGGVGLAALDIAKKIGAVTIGTASAGKHEFLRARGLHHAIDYRTQDWPKAVRDLTQGRGVELVIDPIGGKTWKQNYKVLRHTGRLGMFGISTASTAGRTSKLGLIKMIMQMPWFSPVGLMNGNKSVFGANLGHLWHEGAKVRGWMQDILQGVQDGWVRPHVDRAFPFEQAGAAHAYMEERKNIGKVVLVP